MLRKIRSRTAWTYKRFRLYEQELRPNPLWELSSVAWEPVHLPPALWRKTGYFAKTSECRNPRAVNFEVGAVSPHETNRETWKVFSIHVWGLKPSPSYVKAEAIKLRSVFQPTLCTPLSTSEAMMNGCLSAFQEHPIPAFIVIISGIIGII